MPVDDWQFWIVTAAALWGAFAVARPFLPRKAKPTGGCPGCAAGAAAMRPKRVRLTVGGK